MRHGRVNAAFMRALIPKDESGTPISSRASLSPRVSILSVATVYAFTRRDVTA